MFKDTKAFSSFSVNNLEQAKEFYGTILGLEIDQTPQGLNLHIAGSSPVFVYPKDNHIPATFTVLNFLVNSVDEVVEGLTAKGIHFERYDEGYLKTDEKGIARGDGGSNPSIAWFKDPAGNFLSVLEEKK